MIDKYKSDCTVIRRPFYFFVRCETIQRFLTGKVIFIITFHFTKLRNHSLLWCYNNCWQMFLLSSCLEVAWEVKATWNEARSWMLLLLWIKWVPAIKKKIAGKKIRILLWSLVNPQTILCDSSDWYFSDIHNSQFHCV